MSLEENNIEIIISLVFLGADYVSTLYSRIIHYIFVQVWRFIFYIIYLVAILTGQDDDL